ncbi:hypothetical protein [Companilactobacillus ginsenosidimutans]|uniref:Uncharacterized protein n=1 Tax=Companilactobacillus ginsenosidimutans TaxID=1007676 RepID=A0A0H4QL53_9LACO|nr:hypothetical protein [Companilactobacillus ginsenosidimutans]AKP67438.1 hypothetical protein ABM34_07755 [Companilactobacillus ginsenosidimutans]
MNQYQRNYQYDQRKRDKKTIIKVILIIFVSVAVGRFIFNSGSGTDSTSADSIFSDFNPSFVNSSNGGTVKITNDEYADLQERVVKYEAHFAGIDESSIPSSFFKPNQFTSPYGPEDVFENVADSDKLSDQEYDLLQHVMQTKLEIDPEDGIEAGDVVTFSITDDSSDPYFDDITKDIKVTSLE